MNGNESSDYLIKKAIFSIRNLTDWELYTESKLSGNRFDVYWVSSYHLACGRYYHPTTVGKKAFRFSSKGFLTIFPMLFPWMV
jgi:hypothetical protein